MREKMLRRRKPRQWISGLEVVQHCAKHWGCSEEEAARRIWDDIRTGKLKGAHYQGRPLSTTKQ